MTMVKLTNISKDAKTISCEYCPENSDQLGYVELDCESEEIVNIKYSDYEYGKKMYAAHAIAKLIELSRLDSMPKEAYAIWF